MSKNEQKKRSASTTSPSSRRSCRRRNKANSLCFFPLYGQKAASSTVPTDSAKITTKRKIGKPKPGFCDDDCGYAFWFASVSGIDAVEPSTTFTLRQCQRHAVGACFISCLPVERVSLARTCSGILCLWC